MLKCRKLYPGVKNRASMSVSDTFEQACEVFFWTLDRANDLVTAGQGWERVLGLAPSECPKDRAGWMELFHPVDRAEAEAALLCSDHRRPITLEARLRHKDGHWRWVRLKGRSLDGGQRMVGLAEEITFSKSLALRAEERRRAAEEALRLSEEMYRGLYEHTTEHLFVVGVDPQGELRYLSLNPAHQKATGLSESELAGKTPHECLPPAVADHVSAHYRRCLETGIPVAYEEELELPKGRINWLTQLIPLRNSEGEIMRLLGICTDLTQLKEQEKALRLAQRRESVGRIASGIAHDFNNLLTVIICQLGLMEFELLDSRELRGQVEEISQAAQRAAELTRGLLNLGGQQAEKPSAQSWDLAIGKLKAILAGMVSRGVALHYHLEPVGAVRAVPVHLDQILLNLVGNASESNGERGGRIDIRVSEQRVGESTSFLFAADPPPVGVCVTLEVSDDGPGFDQGSAHKLFASGVSSKGAGRGLGLATVLSLVKEMGGALSASAAPGEGATFKVFLPLCDQPPAVLEQPEGMPLEKLAGRILFCSEERPLRRSLAGLWAHFGLEFEETTHPRELLSLLAKAPEGFDAVVLDVTRKEQQDAVLAGLQAIAPGMKALLMSDIPAGDLLLGNSYRAPQAFLQKPFRPCDLYERLRDLLLPSDGD